MRPLACLLFAGCSFVAIGVDDARHADGTRDCSFRRGAAIADGAITAAGVIAVVALPSQIDCRNDCGFDFETFMTTAALVPTAFLISTLVGVTRHSRCTRAPSRAVD